MHALGLRLASRNALPVLSTLIAVTGGCATTTGDPLTDGTAAYREGRTADAELIWRESLAESEVFGEQDPRLAQSLFALANLAIHQQRYDDAKPLLERWLEIQERKYEEMDESHLADGVDAPDQVA